jgi:UDP-N-acetyl-D-glucosamine dehydrogenase
VNTVVACKVVVIGQGSVGLPLAIAAVEAGHSVVGLDLNKERVARLSGGDSFSVDVTHHSLLSAIQSGRYSITSDVDACRDFDVAVIAVPSPLTANTPDVSHIVAAATALSAYVRSGSLIILESTSYPGTTEEVVVPILEAGSGLSAGRDFGVGFSPERIDPGSRQWTFRSIPKLVSGIDSDSLRRVDEFYRMMVSETVLVRDTRSAELAKLIENTFRQVNIALVNELAIISANLGLDIWEALDAASTKPFGFLRFAPGPGVGGHCLPVDPTFLSWTAFEKTGRSSRLIDLANEVNSGMPHYVYERIEGLLEARHLRLDESQILVLGLAYKANVGDTRQSPAVALIHELSEAGATVLLCDPLVAADDVAGIPCERVDLSVENLRMSHVTVILTDHDAFDKPLIAAHAQEIFDTRRCIVGGNVTFI